jgi:hypothetical protein
MACYTHIFQADVLRFNVYFSRNSESLPFDLQYFYTTGSILVSVMYLSYANIS